MQNQQSAERIVRIQQLLRTATLPVDARNRLVEEQRNLWDRDHPNRAFDEIEHDVWLTKREAFVEQEQRDYGNS